MICVAGQNAYVDPGPSGSYYNPAAEGNYIVFQGATTGGYDNIYLYDREAQQTELISSMGLDGDQNNWNARIQGGKVVWEKDTADPTVGSGIYLYDTSTHDKKIDPRRPRVPGPRYLGRLRGVRQGRDLRRRTQRQRDRSLQPDDLGATTVIATGDKNNEHPRIDGGKVVWSSGDIWTPDSARTWSTTYQVCLYDIGSAGTTVLTSDAAGNLNPDIGGDLVVWQTWTPSTIKGYSISSDSHLRHFPARRHRPLA